MKKKVVITGGGTGGHVFPALAIAEELRKRKISVIYVGSKSGMESRFVPEKGFPFFAVSSGALKNQGLLKRFSGLLRLLRGVLWSFRFLVSEKPQLVIGVGGYVSAPVCLAAFFLRIPVFLQEQNASVGITNRLLGKLASQIFLGFEEASSAFPKGRTLVTGNPLREIFYSSSEGPPEGTALLLASPKVMPYLLVLGGSQGAHAVNAAMMEIVPELKARFPEVGVLHQTGKSDFEKVKAHYESLGLENVKVEAFISQMFDAYQRASLVVCRAGALTVSELIQMGKPALFVPYPRRGQNDQTANAQMLESRGGARVVEQGLDFHSRLKTALFEIWNPLTLQDMAQKSSQLRSANGLATIAELCENALR